MADGDGPTTIVVENDQLFLVESSDKSLSVKAEVREDAVDCDFFQDGTLFDSSHHFEECLQRYMDATHSVFVRVNSRTTATYNKNHQVEIDPERFKYSYMAYACKRFGEVKHEKGYRGLRKRKNNYRIGCKAKFGVYYNRNLKLYKLAGCQFEHNHPLGPEYDIIYPERRQLTEEESNSVQEMVEQNFAPKDIIQELNLQNKITPKDIKNFRVRLSKNPDQKLRRGSRWLPAHTDLLDHQYLRLDHQDPADDDSTTVASLPDDVAYESPTGPTEHQTPVSLRQLPKSKTESMLSVEVINTGAAAPAVDLEVEVWLLIPDNHSWVQLAMSRTDKSGRCDHLLTNNQVTLGSYKIVLNTEPYFVKRGELTHFPHIEIEFKLRDIAQKFHIPVQLSANGYSTSCCVW